MKININNKYHAAFDGRLLGYVGETNARTIDIVQPLVENADTYRLRFEYSDGTVYDVPIVDGEITLTASILRESGEVNCQWIATKANGDTYELVAKSQVFALLIGESISDDVAPIPSPDVAVSALEEIKSNVQQVSDVAAEINSTANAVENTAQQVDNDYSEIMSAKSEVASNAETARTAAESAQASAELAKQYAEGGQGVPSDEDVLLGTLPYTINDNNCYITADSDATITNGGGATDIYAREGEYLIGSPTIEWGNRSAIVTIGSNSLAVYTHLSFDWTPSKTYTLLWKSDLTGAIIRILYRTTEGSATTEYLGTILIQGTQSASSIGSYNYTSFTVPEGAVRLNLAFGVNGSATSGRTITFYDLMLLEGEYTAPPQSQTFTLHAGEKMPVDGYIGSTLECTNGVTVSVYQKQDSSDTDSGGVIFFGDSILDFSNVIERYSKKTGKSCIDCAVGGTRMSASRDSTNEYYPYDMTQIVDAIVNDDLSAQVNGGKSYTGFVTLSTSNIAAYKAIVCEFGTNDFTADVPFEGSTSSSVEGAMRYIIEQITTAYPSIRLVFVGTKRFVGIGVDDDTHIHADGTTEDMNAIMRKTCEEYGIPFIDMIHLFGDTAITRSTLTADGVHLREPQGAKRYADILTAQLNQIGI